MVALLLPFFLSQLNVGNNARLRHHRTCFHFRRAFAFLSKHSLLFLSAEMRSGIFGFISASVPPLFFFLFSLLTFKSWFGEKGMFIPCKLAFVFVFFFLGFRFRFCRCLWPSIVCSFIRLCPHRMKAVFVHFLYLLVSIVFFFPCSASAMTACGRCSIYIYIYRFSFSDRTKVWTQCNKHVMPLIFSLHMFSLSIRAAFFKGTCWSYVRAPIFSLVRRRFTPALCGFLLYGGARCHNGWSRPSINKHNDLKNERHALRYASWSERAKG